MVPAGLLAGLVLLAVVYVGLERVGLRIPTGAFFVGTGAFLYAMAIVFAGRGIGELQEAALVSLTPVRWAPRRPSDSNPTGQAHLCDAPSR